MEQSVTRLNLSSLFYLYLTGFIIIGGIYKESGSYNWVSATIAAVFGAVILLACTRLLNIYRNLNLFEIFSNVLGKYFGILVALIYVAVAVFLGSLLVRLFITFICANSLDETPEYIIAAFLVITCVAVAHCGMENAVKISYFLFPVVLFGILFSLSVSIKSIDTDIFMIEKMPPIGNLLKNSWQYLSILFSQIVFFMIGFSQLKRPRKWSRSIWISYLFSAITIVIIIFRNVAVLGYDLASKYYFLSYSLSSVFSLGNLFERVETLIFAVYAVTIMFQLAIYIISASKGMSFVLKVNYRKTTFFIGALVLVLSLTIFENIMELFNLLSAFSHYAFWCIGFLPVIIWPFAEILNIKKQLSQNNSK